MVLPCLIFLLLGGGGCAGFEFRDPGLNPTSEEACVLEGVKPVRQEAFQCGPASLESVMTYWGQPHSADEMAAELGVGGERGILNFALVKLARDKGFWTQTPPCFLAEDLKEWIRKGVPPIVMMQIGLPALPTYHYVVLTGFDDRQNVFFANIGASRMQALPYRNFLDRFARAGHWTLIVAASRKVNWELKADEANELALLLESQWFTAEAEAWFKKASALEPWNPTIRYNLGNFYFKSARWSEAESVYLEVIRLRPEWTEPNNNLAWLYLEKGRAEDALGVIRAAYGKGAKKTPDILDTEMKALEALGRTDEVNEIRKSLATPPGG